MILHKEGNRGTVMTSITLSGLLQPRAAYRMAELVSQ